MCSGVVEGQTIHVLHHVLYMYFSWCGWTDLCQFSESMATVGCFKPFLNHIHTGAQARTSSRSCLLKYSTIWVIPITMLWSQPEK